MIDHDVSCRIGKEDLPAVADGSYASAADDGWSEVVALVAQRCLAGVQGHADADWVLRWPRFLSERALDIEGRGERVGSLGEHGNHAVALALLDRTMAAVQRDRRVEKFVVPGDQPSGAFSQ